MTAVTSVAFRCPCCGAAFHSTVCPAANTLGPTTTDFFAMSAGVQSIHHQVHTCPECGYTFQEMEDGELQEEVRGFVLDVISPRLEGGEVSSCMKFEFLALIDEFLGSGYYSLGMTYLQAAWACYDMGHHESERHYRAVAVEYLREALETGDLERDILYLVPYLIAEQYRRIGDAGSAREWYDRLLGMDQGHPDRDFFEYMAVQQRDDPKEFMGEVIHEGPTIR
ncbi:MAG: DUF2225 domain-containing protein [bacterium]|nr:MAG: DUF2225 domain-containing protein [bacterium]